MTKDKKHSKRRLYNGSAEDTETEVSANMPVLAPSMLGASTCIFVFGFKRKRTSLMVMQGRMCRTFLHRNYAHFCLTGLERAPEYNRNWHRAPFS
jgi:hypothetical protein